VSFGCLASSLLLDRKGLGTRKESRSVSIKYPPSGCFCTSSFLIRACTLDGSVVFGAGVKEGRSVALMIDIVIQNIQMAEKFRG